MPIRTSVRVGSGFSTHRCIFGRECGRFYGLTVRPWFNRVEAIGRTTCEPPD